MKAFAFAAAVALAIGIVACQAEPQPCPPCPEPEKSEEGPDVEKASGFARPIKAKEPLEKVTLQKAPLKTPLASWRDQWYSKYKKVEKSGPLTLEQYKEKIAGIDFDGLDAAVTALKTASDAEWEAKHQALLAKANEIKTVLETPYPGTDQDTQDVIDAWLRSVTSYIECLGWLPGLKEQGPLDPNSFNGLYSGTFKGFQAILFYKLDSCQGQTKPDDCDCGGIDVTGCNPQPFAA